MVSTGLTQTRHCEFKLSDGSIAGRWCERAGTFLLPPEKPSTQTQGHYVELGNPKWGFGPSINKGRGHSDFLASLATSAWGHQLSAISCIAVRGCIHQDVMLRAAWCRMSADRVRQHASSGLLQSVRIVGSCADVPGIYTAALLGLQRHARVCRQAGLRRREQFFQRSLSSRRHEVETTRHQPLGLDNLSHATLGAPPKPSQSFVRRRF